MALIFAAAVACLFCWSYSSEFFICGTDDTDDIGVFPLLTTSLGLTSPEMATRSLATEQSTARTLKSGCDHVRNDNT